MVATAPASRTARPIATHASFLLWLAYGIAADNLALIIPNTVAAIVIVVTIVVALRYRRVE